MKYLTLTKDIKQLNDFELRELWEEVSQFKQEIANEIINKNDHSFDAWLEYNEEKINYKYITYLPDDSLLRDFIHKKIMKNRYETITLSKVLEDIEYELENESITLDDVNNIKQDILTLNFGSVFYDW